MAGKKGPNFNELEKCTLIELIGSRKDIIESKTSDARMIQKKNKEWDDLASEFNSRHGVHQRTTAQLKSLWKNLKSKTKSAVAKERREQAKTGGGIPEVDTDKISSAVREIIPQQITSCTNAYDDDAELHGHTEKSIESSDPVPGTSSTQSPTATTAIKPTSPISNIIPECANTENLSFGLKTKKSLSGKNIIKRKAMVQDDTKQKMLEMAEKEHKLKMEVLQLKKEYIEMKKKETDGRMCL